MRISVLFFFLVSVLCVPALHAQIDPSLSAPQYVDPADLKSVLFKNKSTEKPDTGTPQKGKLILFVVPAIGSNPSLGAFYGVGATGAMFLGDPATTSISNLSSSILFTTKNQFVGSLRGTIMTPGNGWEMLADFKYSFFSENTYGLGSDDSQPINESWNWGGVQTAGVSGAQPMTFNQVKIYYTALKEIADHIYVGIGYHLDYHYKIKDLSLNLEATEQVVTSHYAYSQLNGFSTTNYTTSGTSFNFVYDSRDHTVNAYKGAFLQLAFRTNPEFLGSEKDSKQLYMEARVFKSLSKERPRHLLGFWGIANVEISGSLPYLHMPASAYDMRNRIGRGYVAGRFRGPGWVTAETEYRFPITRNGVLGGVLFASATTTSRDAIVVGTESLPKLNLFEALRPAGGVGARVMLNRTGRLNLTMDMAFGQNGAKGFYLAVGETF